MLTTGTLTGTREHPELRLRFSYHATHPGNRLPLREHVKIHCDARWDKATSEWVITGVPPEPDKFFADAGIRITLDPKQFGVATLAELRRPVGVLDRNRRQVVIHPGFASYPSLTHLLGPAAVWDRGSKAFKLSLTDVYHQGTPRPGIEWETEALEAATAMLTAPHGTPGFEEVAADLGRAISAGPDYTAWLHQTVAAPPEWLTRTPFPHQIPGAYAAVLGHRLIADEPGVGKSFTAIYAAALRGATKIVVVCPPALALNWGREFEKAGFPHQVRVMRPGKRKTNDAPFPDAGVVVVGDSLLVTRPALLQRLTNWRPDTLIVDEAHRMKTMTAKRTNAVLDLAAHIPISGRFALTGTPVVAGAHELVPILELTGHLGPVFGGATAFLNRFTTYLPKIRRFMPKRASLPELNALLKQHVWVHRPKFRVLQQLQQPLSTVLELEVDTANYRDAHTRVVDTLTEWVAGFTEAAGAPPDEADIDQYVSECAIGLVSHLRVGSALTKLTYATELILEHVTADPDRESPLVVWLHHREVQLALAEQLEEAGVEYRMIVGGMTQAAIQASVDAYQAGTVQVLLCSITAAGVGLTLTRGNESLFVETDWTPAVVSQAVDRQNRIGQTRIVHTRTLVALGTLDEHIQRVQRSKQQITAAIHHSDQSGVALLDRSELVTPREIIHGLLIEIIRGSHVREGRPPTQKGYGS